MVFLVGFGYILQHFTLRFVAFCLAFWCILPCVLVHIAVRFGAKCNAFCCKMQCVLLQNALQQLAINLHFLVVADANLGVLFFKEKCKSIVNGQKRKGKALKKCRNFIVWAYFIWFLAVVFF